MLLLDRHAPAPPVAAQRLDERRRTQLVLAAALLVCLGLRLLYLRFPLGVDEGGVAFIARAWGTGHGSLYGAYWLDRPPLLVALYKLALVAGPTGLRLLGALAALALVATTTLVTRSVAGERAARVAAVLSAGLACSIALGAVHTPAELLASVPAVGSIACLVAAHRRGEARWLVGAGLLAVAAVLIKQSFLDAGFAGVVFLIASSVRDRRMLLRRAAAYTAGALIALAPVAAWLALAHVSPASLAYALFGFRIHALHALAASSIPLHVRVRGLLAPGAASGLFVVLVVALRGVGSLRRDRVLALTLAAWLGAGTVGVLGGGSYWSHYLIQLVAPASVLAGAALSSVRPRFRAGLAAALAALAIVGTVVAVPRARTTQERRGVVAVAGYVRAHARPRDTQYVMYARANVGYYTGLPSPYPYAWSLLVRAHPGATSRLRHLLESPQRPTWVVGWQPPNRWRLDPGGATARALHAHYRVVAHVHGHPIYHRTSSPRSSQ
jgi:4-amino-4-deoxy-L-arabinose transferase-like glycosyltransferase